MLSVDNVESGRLGPHTPSGEAQFLVSSALKKDFRDIVKAPVKTGMEQEMKVLYRERGSDPPWPRAMRRRPVMAWRSVSRGAHRPSIELRNHPSGVPTLYNGGEGNMNRFVSARTGATPRSQRPGACAYAPCTGPGRSYTVSLG
jgi:hypothetical protein